MLCPQDASSSSRRAPSRVSRRMTVLQSTSNANATGALADSDLVIRCAQASPTARRCALALASLSWPCYASYTACPCCNSQTCGWGWAGDGWNTLAY